MSKNKFRDKENEFCPCNIHLGGADFQEDVLLRSKFVKDLCESGYVLCDFCGSTIPCLGKAEYFVEAWKHSPSGDGYELQSICKWAAENGLAKKCQFCDKESLCSKEVFAELGNQCPECYRDYDTFYNDIWAAAAEYIDGIHIDDLIEHFGHKKIGGKKVSTLEDMFR